MKKLVIIGLNYSAGATINGSGMVTYVDHLISGLQQNGIEADAVKLHAGQPQPHVRHFSGHPYRNVSIEEAKQLVKDYPSITNSIGKQWLTVQCELVRMGSSPLVHDYKHFNDAFATAAQKGKTLCIGVGPVEKRMLGEYGVRAMWCPQPFREEDRFSASKTKPICSATRLSWEKNSLMLIEAAKRLKRSGIKLDIYGRISDHRYQYSVLDGTGYEEFYNGRFLHYSDVLLPYTYAADMSLLEKSGALGRTQYSYMEAMACGCIPIVHRGWLTDDGEMQDGFNCLAADSPEEIANIVLSGKQLKEDRRSKVLELHSASTVALNLYNILEKEHHGH